MTVTQAQLQETLEGYIDAMQTKKDEDTLTDDRRRDLEYTEKFIIETLISSESVQKSLRDRITTLLTS